MVAHRAVLQNNTTLIQPPSSVSLALHAKLALPAQRHVIYAMINFT